MARKLPWAEVVEPPKKRQRTEDSSNKPSPAPRSRNADIETTGPVIPEPPIFTHSRRRALSRSPSTSPPPDPPDVEPMRKGYEADDMYMMVEDEFQTLAQSFTRHLHHAEYKRLVKKAKEAPRKPLPEPVSPMSKKTKDRLNREILTSKQQEALDRVISPKRVAQFGDTDEEKVDDPWRGTHLAGLMATGSQEKRSLKGLERLPSSTRAARGFSRLDSENDEQDGERVSATTQILGGSLLSKKQPQSTKDSRHEKELVSELQRSPMGKPFSPEALFSERDSTPTRERTASPSSLSASNQGKLNRSPLRPDPPRKTTLPPRKQKRVKEESKEDRLSEMPMFLF